MKFKAFLSKKFKEAGDLKKLKSALMLQRYMRGFLTRSFVAPKLLAHRLTLMNEQV